MDLKKLIPVLLTIGCLLAVCAVADVPHLVNFQGTLMDSIGNPIDEVVSELRFTFYSDSTGGLELLGQTLYNVSS